MSNHGPLTLAQILIEEYEHLCPEETKTERAKEAKNKEDSAQNTKFPKDYLDCRFQKDHIRNPARFAIKLRSIDGREAPDELELRLRQQVQKEAPGELTKYYQVAEKVDADYVENILTGSEEIDEQNLMDSLGAIPQPSESLQDVIVEQLNKLLEQNNLHQYFKGSEELIPLKERLGQEALPKFNRHLLEKAFPTDIIPLNETLSGVYSHLHLRHYAALCISGGGIRSGTFALGVIQGLARCGLLDKFDYLSTVSGGGYIGSWLTSWIHRHRNGEAGVVQELRDSPTSKTEVEPEPIRHLRSYSNYLSPKLGFLSADTWTLIAIYLRNLTLNWLVLVPLIAAVLMIPRIYGGIINKIKTGTVGAEYITSHPKLMSAILYIGIIAGGFAIAYIGFNRPSVKNARDEKKDREERSYRQKTYLLCCLMPLILSSILLTIYWAWYRTTQNNIIGIGSFVIFGVVINVTGYVLWIVFRLHYFGYKSLLEIVFACFSGAIAGWLIWLAAEADFFFPSPDGKYEIQFATYVCLAVPMLLGIFMLSAFLFNGLISFYTTDDDREWWSRSDAWVLIAIIGWAAICGLVIFGPTLIGKGQTYVASVGSLSGFLTLWLGHSDGTTADQKRSEETGLSSIIKEKALSLAAPVFAVFLLALISLATTLLLKYIAASELGRWIESTLNTVLCIDYAYAHPDKFHDWFDNAYVIQWAPFKLVIGFTITLLMISFGMAGFININRYSLHSMYRNRLIRAYLGASNLNRKPNKFTGFDPTDNLQMHELWPNTKAGTKRKKLFHIVNMALNLVEDENLAWQQRKAESFTVSPLHCGSYRKSVGYRRSNEYGGKEKKSSGKNGGISLGTAIAISGAAASPNMGYHSSTFITFLMTLFNARLGWWLGNPGRVGEKTYNLEGPYFALKPLIAETLGLTNDNHSYVYLSDGGHFENLGLYEMVLRRCRFIVISDGSQDNTGNFESLGNAVRKIRIDLGIPIEFTEKICIYPRTQERKKGEEGKYCAIGKIRYSCVDGSGISDGIVLYIKPAFYGDEPRDIYEYAQSNSLFPHESTADQFFTESQFESYRMLGSHITQSLCLEGDDSPNLDYLLRKVVSYLYPEPSPSGSKSNIPDWLSKWLKPEPDK